MMAEFDELDHAGKRRTMMMATEWPRILHWAIQGCLAWQQQGLAPPAAVTKATEDYLAAQDALAAWLEECCDRIPTEWTDRGVLYASWQVWATAAGAHVGTRSEFLDALEDKGFEQRRRSTQRGFVGIALKP
jgi:putative DNA primase/helicase